MTNSFGNASHVDAVESLKRASRDLRYLLTNLLINTRDAQALTHFLLAFVVEFAIDLRSNTLRFKILSTIA